MAQVSGRFSLDTLLGQVFIGSTAAGGVTVPSYNTGAAVFALWNPLGSGKNAYLMYCTIGFVSTTAAPSNYVLAYQTGVGSQVGTGSPITAYTAGTPVNGFLGQGNASVMRFAPATLTLATAPTYLMTLGTSQLTTTGATTSAPYFQSYTDFQGAIVIPQGCVVVVAGNTATTTVNDISLIWEEV
jgi:hypothetical protein